MVTDAAAGNYYVVVSLLADPKKSQALCTPHPTTLLTATASPAPGSGSGSGCKTTSPDGTDGASEGTAAGTGSGTGGVDVESPFLFSLLDQEEETHTVYHSASPVFDRWVYCSHTHAMHAFTYAHKFMEREGGRKLRNISLTN